METSTSKPKASKVSPPRPIRNLDRLTKSKLNDHLPVQSTSKIGWREASHSSELGMLAAQAKRRKTARSSVSSTKFDRFSISSESSSENSNYESCEEGESDAGGKAPNIEAEDESNRHPSDARQRLASAESENSPPSNYPPLQQQPKHERNRSFQAEISPLPSRSSILYSRSTLSPRSSIRMSLNNSVGLYSPTRSTYNRNSISSFKMKPLILTPSRTVAPPPVTISNVSRSGRPSSALGYYFESSTTESRRRGSQSSFNSRRTASAGSPDSSLGGWDEDRPLKEPKVEEMESLSETPEGITASYPSFQTFDRRFATRTPPTIELIEASPAQDVKIPGGNRLSQDLLASSKALSTLLRSDSHNSQSQPPTPPPSFPLPVLPTEAGQVRYQNSSEPMQLLLSTSRNRGFASRTRSKLFSKQIGNILALENDDELIISAKSERASVLPSLSWPPPLDAPTRNITASTLYDRVSSELDRSVDSRASSELDRSMDSREPREAREPRGTYASVDTTLQNVLMNGPEQKEVEYVPEEKIIISETKKRFRFFKKTATSIKSVTSSTSRLSTSFNSSKASVISQSSGEGEHILDFIEISPPTPPKSERSAYSSSNRGGVRRLELSYPVLTSGKRGSIFPSRISKR